VVEVVEQFDFASFIEEFAWFFKAGLVFDAESKELKKILKLLEEVPFPLPIVVNFSAQGEIEILLTKPLLLPTKSDMAEFIGIFHKDQYIALSILATEDHPRLEGKPVYKPEYFELEREEQKESARRGLQDDSAQTLEKEDDSEVERSIEDLSFNWTVTSYNSTRIFLQLNFSDPEFVSLDMIDKLDLEYKEPTKFLVYALT